MNGSAKSTCWLLAALFALLGAGTAAAQTTATDTITLSFSETGGMALLGITDVYVDLAASETGVSGMEPGQRYTFTVQKGEAKGGRLHYTVHGQSGPLKITVRTLTPIAAGSLTIAVASATTAGAGDGVRGTAVQGAVAVGTTPRDLILDIGDCYTGTGPADGPLLYYTLVGNPGFSLGDVMLEYTLGSGL
jgi:hypothetical protein